ncbi:M20/M25/M40 family metallo-hydrolase [Conexibacter woesei]|uniref:M20/M25/M40 family metallo-hydrolase n=1 Tax=Conexibacter woesei TaxID=191495 RepID=UPI0003F7D24C|nr:M20/M25/M40 family metallo-hydrolase [Conexibacter woesei]
MQDLLSDAAVGATAAELVRVPSLTGDERAALERCAELARGLGLRAELVAHDLAALRAHPDYPGEEAEGRTELYGLVVTPREAPSAGGPRLALCGHIDVVGVGTVPWQHGGPWSGAVVDGFVHGRGSADMKGGVAAALHALAAAGPSDAVLHVVASEEDGGLGAFAMLQRDAAFDGCVIPEPTGFDVVCAQAGTVTFTGTVHGVAAHAAERLHGVSAIDRYVKVHAALAAVERAYNTDVAHPLMAVLPLPYPLVVGKIAGGEWSSSVPDRVVFEGRAPVRVGESLDTARAAIEDAVAAVAAKDGWPIDIAWTGGVFESATTPERGALAQCVLSSVTAQLGRPARAAGVPWGADMRLYAAAGVPTVMLGPRGIDVAHAVDERVALADLGVCARILADVIAGFPRFAADPAYAA